MVEVLNGSFVCLKVDGDKDKELAAKFHLRGYPSIVFLNGDGEMVHMAAGFMPPAKFLEMLKAPAAELKKFDELKAALEKSPEDPKLNFDYALALFKRGKAEEGNAALDKVLACDPEDKAGFADDVDLARVEQMLAAKAFADAEAAIKTFMEKRPESDLLPKACLFLGVAEVNQNKFDEGIAVWKALIEKYPGAAEAKNAQAMIPRAEKRKEALQKKQETEGK